MALDVQPTGGTLALELADVSFPYDGQFPEEGAMLIEAAVAAAAGKWLVEKAREAGIDLALDKFKEHVVGRWSGHRAALFLAQLLEEVQKQRDVRYESASLNDLLSKLMRGDAESSLLFDAYRRVALCASKDIGPMIIGVLTAVILLRDSQADDEEEQMFMAAETLNDRDFVDFICWFKEARRQAGEPKHPSLQLPVIPGTVAVTRVRPKAARNTFSTEDIPINLFSDVGSFAPKLANLGILVQFTLSAAPTKNAIMAEHFVAATHVATRLYAIAERVLSVKQSSAG